MRVGYFGPNDPQHPLGGTFWVGASRAIGEANREGGYQGLPFRLVQAWSENPWTAGASAVVRMAYSDKVWAVLSGIDGVTAHLAEQVVAKARLPLIDMGSTDRSVNLANVPWTFSLAPPDSAIAEALGEALGGGGFVLFSATDHDSRALAGQLLDWLRKRQRVPARHVQFAPGTQDAAWLAAQADAPAAVVIAGPRDSARAVEALRHALPALNIYGGPAMGRTSFQGSNAPSHAPLADARGSEALILSHDRPGAVVSEAGHHTNVRFPELATPSDELPDYAAVYGYQAVRLLVSAVRKAGLNRARIRDAIQELDWWDALNRRQGPVRIRSSSNPE